MADESAPGPAPKDGSMFRAIIGFVALAAGIVGFIALFFVEVPAANNNALMFAMGIVFGWGSSIISSEYGSSSTGRKIADEAVKQMGQGTTATEKKP
jgi:hypothetical protein